VPLGLREETVPTTTGFETLLPAVVPRSHDDRSGRPRDHHQTDQDQGPEHQEGAAPERDVAEHPGALLGGRCGLDEVRPLPDRGDRPLLLVDRPVLVRLRDDPEHAFDRRDPSRRSVGALPR
jgi:hypothetical protein